MSPSWSLSVSASLCLCVSHRMETAIKRALRADARMMLQRLRAPKHPLQKLDSLKPTPFSLSVGSGVEA
jgi:hypothetical protein